VFGNLTVGHLFVRGPDEAPTKTPANGLLSADYTVANGRWRFARVYAGENWNPLTVAPLTGPGVNVRAGEYLLAVDGRPLKGTDNVEQALEGTAGKSVVLRVGPKPDGSGARDVTVVPVASETMLRHLAWIDHNRRVVDSLSGGKLAYIYVPNTANEGCARFNRYFFAQQDKLGAVVDERFNGGGNIADYMVDYLRRDAPVQLGDVAVRRRRADSGRRHLRSEGDADQRVRRLGRRRAALAVPALQGRAADRHADLGRPGRHRRLPDTDGWGPSHGAKGRPLDA
jgi:hypothetical protein